MQAARLSSRLQRELKMLHTDPPPGVCAWPCNHSLTHLQAQIQGPEGTVYSRGIFKLEVHIPERYPFEPPNITFVTPIYHPNIDNGGRICLDILVLPPKGAWRPSLNLATVLASIGILLADPNPDDGLMSDITAEFKHNRSSFDLKARSWTQQYATQEAAAQSSEPSHAIAVNQNTSNTMAYTHDQVHLMLNSTERSTGDLSASLDDRIMLSTTGLSCSRRIALEEATPVSQRQKIEVSTCRDTKAIVNKEILRPKGATAEWSAIRSVAGDVSLESDKLLRKEIPINKKFKLFTEPTKQTEPYVCSPTKWNNDPEKEKPLPLFSRTKPLKLCRREDVQSVTLQGKSALPMNCAEQISVAEKNLVGGPKAIGEKPPIIVSDSESDEDEQAEKICRFSLTRRRLIGKRNAGSSFR